MQETTIKYRIKKVLADNGNASIYSLGNNENERTNLSRQINGNTKVSLETVERVLERYPEVSAEWLIRGEGLMERTKIVMPPTRRQDIHLDAGATAAISQNGNATIGGMPDTQQTQQAETLVRLIQNNDIAGMVAILMRQQGEITQLRSLLSD